VFSDCCAVSSFLCYVMKLLSLEIMECLLDVRNHLSIAGEWGQIRRMFFSYLIPVITSLAIVLFLAFSGRCTVSSFLCDEIDVIENIIPSMRFLLSLT
jgi:hypothetical protein